MKSFTDSNGKTWELSLTITAAKRVMGLLGVNLLQLDEGTPPLLTRLGTDVMLLCDVIYAILKPALDGAGLTDEQFGAALGGKAVLDAQTAFYEELVDFFQQSARMDLVQAVKTQRSGIELAVARNEDRISRLDLLEVVKEAEAEALAESIPGRSSGSSPADAASIPAP